MSATDTLVLSPNFWETPGYAGVSDAGLPTIRIGGQTFEAFKDSQDRYRVAIPSFDDVSVDFGALPNYSAQTIGSWAALQQSISGADVPNYYGFDQPASVLDQPEYWSNPEAFKQIEAAMRRGDTEAARQAAEDGGFDIGTALLLAALAVGVPYLIGAAGSAFASVGGAAEALGAADVLTSAATAAEFDAAFIATYGGGVDVLTSAAAAEAFDAAFVNTYSNAPDLLLSADTAAQFDQAFVSTYTKDFVAPVVTLTQKAAETIFTDATTKAVVTTAAGTVATIGKGIVDSVVKTITGDGDTGDKPAAPAGGAQPMGGLLLLGLGIAGIYFLGR